MCHWRWQQTSFSVCWMLLHELSLINRAHNFPQKILAKLRIPAREIPWLIAAKSSKFRSSTRPPIYNWKKWESCSETSAIEGWHCTMLSYQLSNIKSRTNYYITHYANDRTNQLSFLKFRRQKANSAARLKIPRPAENWALLISDTQKYY